MAILDPHIYEMNSKITNIIASISKLGIMIDGRVSPERVRESSESALLAGIESKFLQSLW
jgi:hypothetical protein